MYAAMDIGIDAAVIVANSIDDDCGLLRGRRIVEIDKGVAIDFLVKYREVTPGYIDIK